MPDGLSGQFRVQCPRKKYFASPFGTRCYSCAFYHYQVHTRPRVQRASGVPRALFGRELMQGLGRIARRGRKRVSRRHCERSEAIHSSFTRRDGLLRFARNDGFMRPPRHTPSRRRPRKRAIQYSGTSMMESKGHSVLDIPHARAMTAFSIKQARHRLFRRGAADRFGDQRRDRQRADIGRVAHRLGGLDRVGDRKSTRLNSSHSVTSRMPSSA